MLIFYLLIVPLIVPLGAAGFCWLCDSIAARFCKGQRTTRIPGRL